GSPGQLHALTRSLQRAAAGAALICADQEGGAVRIVRFAPSAAAPPQLDTPAAAAAAARATARGLRTYGVNVNLAPVADVPAIAAGVPLIMSSHAIYPRLSRLPASQSAAILVGLLRRELGFRGVAITDSLEARAVLSRSSVATAAVRSIRAGNDVALMTGPGS